MKVAVIGAGNWGKNLVANLHALGVLDAVAEPAAALRAALEPKYPGIPFHADHQAVLASDVGAVAIATPVVTHYAVAKAALLADKDVFVEKPLTLHEAEAEELVALARERGRILMVGHLLLYQPAIQAIKSHLDAGLVGEVLGLHQERLNLGKARSVENALWSLGVHDVAVLLYLVGQAPTGVMVNGQQALQSGIEDDVYLHLAFPGKTRAHLHCSWLWPERRRQLTVVGSQAMLVYDELAQSVVLHKKRIGSDLANQDEGSEQLFQGSGEPLRLEMEHFLACLADRREPISSGASGVPVVRVLAEAMRLLEAK